MNQCKYLGLIAVIIFTQLLLISCKQDDVVERNEPNSENKLQFDVVLGEAQNDTRAGESTNEVLKIASIEGFKPPHIVVHAYTGVPGVSLKRYFSDELGYVKTGNRWKVNSDIVRFMPQGGMSVYAYFATDFAEAGDLYDVIYHHPSFPNEHPKLTFTPNIIDALNQVDLIAAKIERTTNPKVHVQFKHILSQINFGVKGLNEHQIRITNIKIHNVYGAGTFDYNTWQWTPNMSDISSYSYYFPDRKDGNVGSGLGDNYRTQGGANDSQNTYIFSDGGRFASGSSDTHFYAQIEPIITNYATKANTLEKLYNSLMLIPQAITQNANATITFDYEITKNNVVISSAINNTIKLNQYFDWEPNKRYVYIFSFDSTSRSTTRDAKISTW